MIYHVMLYYMVVRDGEQEQEQEEELPFLPNTNERTNERVRCSVRAQYNTIHFILICVDRVVIR